MTTIGIFASVFDAQGRVLCVRQAYGDRVWAMPGGRLEPGEDPVAGVRREAFEEAGAVIGVRALVGVYSATYCDDLVLLFTADLRERTPWTATDEISDIGFFPLDALPEPLSENARLRFRDIAAGARGIVRVLSAPGVAREENGLSSLARGAPR